MVFASTTAGALILVTALFLDFHSRSVVRTRKVEMPSTAIVFSGQFDRVELALKLFDTDEIDRIFVSGVNRGAGLDAQGFADRFQASPAARAAIARGKIILATRARSTFENALEAACWIRKQRDLDKVVLITGRLHMPRASVALENALRGSDVSVLRLSTDQSARAQLIAREFLKFGVTRGITMLPHRVWPGAGKKTCG
jgi:uncharacterized SAM-binding protein YcdF (DUF218 family)